MAYHFQIAYVPENIQSIKKYQRGGGQKALWSCTAKRSIASTGSGSVEKVESLETRSAERQQVTNLVMEDKTYSKAHFPWHHIQGRKEESQSVLERWQKTAGGGCPHGGFCPSVLRQKRW